MYWLNIEWADGTESTFEDSQRFATLATAIGHGSQKHAATGCSVYVIGDGSVVAAFVDGKRTI
jgi:hypothetical protein